MILQNRYMWTNFERDWRRERGSRPKTVSRQEKAVLDVNHNADAKHNLQSMFFC